MLGRYTSDAMASIWSDSARYGRWRDVELAVLAAQVRQGRAPLGALEAATAVPEPSHTQVEVFEARVRHDLVAFLDAWTDQMDDSTASYIHRDLTSSDIVDTAQAKALAAASDLILAAGTRLVVALADRALEYQRTLCVARTHGQPAAFDVLGHRFADLAFAVDRALARLVGTVPLVAVANISGPVGTGLALPPGLVADVASSLDLGVPPTTTQVLFRDSIAAWVSDLALLGAVCEAVATDIRIGQHDGIAELAEPRKAGQEGSSAMPHKRNPIAVENITGLARVLRGYVGPSLEDVALWGHRDISHSSVERVLLPDAAAICEHVLAATARVVEGVSVDMDAVRHNIERAGSVLAASRAQSRAQATGLRRSEAAALVRDRIQEGAVSTGDLEEAAAEVLQSETLKATFERTAELRERYLNQAHRR
jgi:adenylosuccinate lyase